jgi:hypothetical protein
VSKEGEGWCEEVAAKHQPTPSEEETTSDCDSVMDAVSQEPEPEPSPAPPSTDDGFQTVPPETEAEGADQRYPRSHAEKGKWKSSHRYKLEEDSPSATGPTNPTPRRRPRTGEEAPSSPGNHPRLRKMDGSIETSALRKNSFHESPSKRRRDRRPVRRIERIPRRDPPSRDIVEGDLTHSLCYRFGWCCYLWRGTHRNGVCSGDFDLDRLCSEENGFGPAVEGLDLEESKYRWW